VDVLLYKYIKERNIPMQYKIISYDEIWHYSQVAILDSDQNEITKLNIGLKGLASISDFEKKVHQVYSASLPPAQSDINLDIINHVTSNLGKDSITLATPASTQRPSDGTTAAIWQIKSNFVSSSETPPIEIV
jgi:hypothetical protein